MSSIWLAARKQTVTSQWGEDGIIEAVFERIGTNNRWCCEVGAWDGKHLSNTWNLIHNGAWQGALIEGEKSRASKLPNIPGVVPMCAFVEVSGPDSLDSLLSRTPIPYDFDLLSIDIDNDDYFVWQSLVEYRPRVVIIEINGRYPAWVDKKASPGFRGFTLLTGTSIKTMVELGKRLGYELAINCGNAIFVRHELASALDIDPDGWQEVSVHPAGVSLRMALRMIAGDIAHGRISF